jgi:hypothetical protein
MRAGRRINKKTAPAQKNIRNKIARREKNWRERRGGALKADLTRGR